MLVSVARVVAVALAFALLLTSGATASPFRPNMWVYEVPVEPVRVDQIVGAMTRAPAGTPVPAGCRSSPATDPFLGPVTEIHISCSGARPSDLGIDVLQTVRQDPLLSYTGMIGFNQTEFVCRGTLVGCPFSRFGDNPILKYFEFDYATGVARYDRTTFPDFSDGSASEAYDLAPTGASMTGILARNYSGVWNYGFGGSWFTGDSIVVRLAGSGTLVQAPTTVPLPASILLLGAGVLGLTSVRRWKAAA